MKLSQEPSDPGRNGSVGDVLSRTSALSLEAERDTDQQHQPPVVNGCATNNGHVSTAS